MDLSQPAPSRRDGWPLYFSLALVGMTFSATGPVAIIITAARDAGLDFAQVSSWLFAVLALNGVASLIISAVTRQPLVFLWTIPGTLLVAPVIIHHGFPAVVGSYLVCAVALVVLGLSNVVAWLDRLVPMPVVMAMIAGLFLKYVVGIVHATVAAPWVGGSMLAVYFVLLWQQRRGSALVPPIIGALVAGALVVLAGGFAWPAGTAPHALATPMLTAPVFNLQAISELVVPMLVTVLFVQNAQGIAVLKTAGYQPSLRLITVASGVLTAVVAPFGGCPSVLAGPCNAILVSAGQTGRHYLGALGAAAISVFIGAFASAYGFVLTSLPVQYIGILAGLAMLNVVEKAFSAAFSSALPLSTLAVFVVTLSDVNLFGIGSAFWGLVCGCVLAAWIEQDFSAVRR
ncbi:benzoate/H(+) symporter BenE family transporter [Pseudomonas typographi]|uniref:benzoate/H(+) symporter BenE family transporter n=1 Tax=Pseudomonas typographi TaxID=2715964 RepID=UPI00168A3125|nr:benzoate/H(+) symporter BenE family transporter [Pseudomonas typographi]MBD1588163.1 benzoate transporter [Pseudomonas typographi]